LTAIAAQHGLSSNASAMWLASLAFLLAFAVKVPVFPLHGWLAGAIEEAPTAAVMVLAGKTGLYSILRFSFGLFPAESHRIAPLMIALGAIGVVYGSLIAMVQSDMKRLAAFSTLGHLSVITLGIFTFTISGVDGGIYQILNHGISGGALFMLMGLLYERYGTYDMREYGGLAAKLPWIVTMFVIVTLSVIGLPMLNSFVGEFLVLSGTMQSVFAHHTLWTVLATTGVIFGAAYMLMMIQKVFYGDLGRKSEAVAGWDLDAREHLALWPLVVLFLGMGVASPIWLKAIDTAGVAIAHTMTPATMPPTSMAQGTRALSENGGAR
jgi:NADH-quinone oxidoreductase subunit M